MSKDFLETHIKLVDGNVQFAGGTADKTGILIDYFPPVGKGQGYTPLELLMLSFSSCMSTTLLTILRHQMKKTVTNLEARARGTARKEHPKALSKIEVDLTIISPDILDKDVKKALKEAEEKLCPVWAMVKGNVKVAVTFTIKKK